MVVNNNSLNISAQGTVYNSGTGTFSGIDAGAASNLLTSNGTGVAPSYQAAVAQLIPWTDVTGTSASMAIKNAYLADNAGLVTLALPAIAAQFSVVKVAGFGVGGWIVAQNAAQLIHFGSATTTTGVTGSLASTNRYDCCTLICVVANTTWTVLDSVGTLTVT